MKKKIIFVFLAFVTFGTIYAQNFYYQGSLAVNANYDGVQFNNSHVDPKQAFRSTFGCGVEANPISFVIFDNHRLSLPFIFEYNTRSAVIGRYYLDWRLSGMLGLRYEYLFGNGFSAGADVYFGHYGFPQLKAGNNFMRFRVMASYAFTDWFSLCVPVAYSFGAAMNEFTFGVSARFNLNVKINQ